MIRCGITLMVVSLVAGLLPVEAVAKEQTATETHQAAGEPLVGTGHAPRAEQTAQREEDMRLAEAALTRFARNTEFSGIVFGDLNGDGVRDFASLVGDTSGSTDGGKLVAAVFLGSPDKTFSFQEVSSDLFAHVRVDPELEIRKKSLFLSRAGSGGCCSRWLEVFQFQMREGRLMLIGVETSNFPTSDPEEGDEPTPDTGVSANLLTGKVIRWSDAGKGKREQKSNAPSLTPVPFKEFDYEVISQKWSDILW